MSGERTAPAPQRGEDEDIVLKILHTADWHLGQRFQSLGAGNEQKLVWARLAAVETLLGVAARNQVDAVLCAGDLFHSPQPSDKWWGGLATTLSESDPARPIFLLPGNHDPLTAGSIYAPQHPFRARLPKWVHVVDRDDFRFELKPGATLFAVPCRSQSGQQDPTEKLPSRPAGDEGIRVGMVHGQTFDLPNCQTNFPISRHAASRLGLDYLALGDTHSFRLVETGSSVPVVYPGTPETTNFGEKEPGFVALVFFPRRGRPPKIRAEPVGRYAWEELRVESMAELRQLCARTDLSRRVLRVTLDLAVTLEEAQELDSLLGVLGDDEAKPGRAGVLLVERERVEISTGALDDLLDGLPPVLQRSVARLRELERDSDPKQRSLATQALRHLYQTLKRPGAAA